MAKRRSKGEGTIYQTKNGYAAQYNYNGKRYTISGKVKNEVRKKLNEALNQIEKGTFIESGKITVGVWCREWLKQKKPFIREQGTYNTYKWRTDRIIEGLGEDTLLKKIKPLDVQNFIGWLMEQPKKRGEGTIKKTTVREVYTTLNSILRSALINDLIPKQISGKGFITIPKSDTGKVGTLSIEELNQLLDTIKKPVILTSKYNSEYVRKLMYIALVIETATGMRIGELLGLRWNDYDSKKHTFKLSQQLTNAGTISSDLKSASSYRELVIDEQIAKIIESYKVHQNESKLFLGELYKKHNLIFCKQDGDRLWQRTFYGWYKKLLLAAGIKNINFHALRHTFVTLGLEEGIISHKTLQEMTGHSSIKTFYDIYSHVTPKMQSEAAGVIAKRINLNDKQ